MLTRVQVLRAIRNGRKSECLDRRDYGREHQLETRECALDLRDEARSEERQVRAALESERTETARLRKMLDVCSAVHGHNVKLKADLESARAELARSRKLIVDWRERAHDLRDDGLGSSAADYEERADELEEALTTPPTSVSPTIAAGAESRGEESLVELCHRALDGSKPARDWASPLGTRAPKDESEET